MVDGVVAVVVVAVVVGLFMHIFLAQKPFGRLMISLLCHFSNRHFHPNRKLH